MRFTVGNVETVLVRTRMPSKNTLNTFPGENVKTILCHSGIPSTGSPNAIEDEVDTSNVTPFHAFRMIVFDGERRTWTIGADADSSEIRTFCSPCEGAHANQLEIVNGLLSDVISLDSCATTVVGEVMLPFIVPNGPLALPVFAKNAADVLARAAIFAE